MMMMCTMYCLTHVCYRLFEVDDSAVPDRQPRIRSFESGDGSAPDVGEGFISFDDSWTKPRPEDIPISDTAFPVAASPQRDSATKTSRSSTSGGKETIGGDVSVERLSISRSGDSDSKDRKGRRRRSRTPKGHSRTSSNPRDDKPRRPSIKGLFQSSSS